MTNVKPKYIPSGPEELYKIITESHDYIDTKDWSRLGQTAKERYTKLFNRLYSVPSLPEVGTVVQIQVDHRPYSLAGIVIEGGPHGRVVVCSNMGVEYFHVYEIKSLSVAKYPFRDSELIW